MYINFVDFSSAYCGTNHLPLLMDVNSIKDLLKYLYELCWWVDLSYKIFSLDIYFSISPVGCISSLPQPLDFEKLKYANPVPHLQSGISLFFDYPSVALTMSLEVIFSRSQTPSFSMSRLARQ